MGLMHGVRALLPGAQKAPHHASTQGHGGEEPAVSQGCGPYQTPHLLPPASWASSLQTGISN